MVCHIWLNRVSGGVDIFFVISGFFMTATLIKLKHRPFTQIYILFWRKILTRIIPIASLIILLSIFIVYWMDYPYRAETIRNAVYSLLFLENIHLMLQHTDYLLSHSKSIFQHFWALSIQLQFYLIYPLIFIFFKTKHILILSSMCLISFVYSVILVSTQAELAYYHPLARLWEFGLGGIICVLYQKNIQIKHGLISVVALLAFLLFAFFHPKDFHFPGFSSLFPVLCASLILLNSAQHPVLSAIVHNPLLLWISEFSFTLYLVHWPILILTQYWTLSSSINISTGIGIILSSIILAYLIHIFLDSKFNAYLNSLKPQTFFAAISVILTLSTALYAALYFENKQRQRLSTTRLQQQALAQNSLKDNIMSLSVLGTSDISRNQCMSYSSELKSCVWGDPHADKAIALVGGSHAEQWLAVIDRFAQKHHYQVIQINKGDCPLGGAEDSGPDCQIWTKKVIDYIAQHKNIKYVVTNSTRSYQNGQREQVPQRYYSSFIALKKRSHAQIIGIRDNARFDINPNQCLTHPSRSSEQCNYPLYQYLALKDPSLQYQHLLTSIDFSSLYCPHPQQCRLNANNIPIYADDNHLSMIYVKMIADRGSQLLENVILKKPNQIKAH